MNTAKRAIESKKAQQRSSSASGTQAKLSASTDSITKNRTTGLRSIGPVTRSLAAAARSAFSSNKNSSSQVNINTITHSRPPVTACSISETCKPCLPSDHVAQNQKALKTEKDKTKSKEIAVSKDSVFSDETDADINWVIGSKYEFTKDTGLLLGNEPRRDPSYIRIAKVLSGYSSRRSTTPDSKMYDTVKNFSSYCTPTRSPLTAKQLTNNVNSNSKSHSSSEVSDNGFCEGKNELEDCSNYSFIVPEFNFNLIDGNAYKELVDSVINLFTSHLIKCEFLLENQNFLPDSIAEAVRVVVGRTKLLMKKRLTQFSKQLESHLNPIKGERITTLNDLHGLWSLVDIQIDDIRQCFIDVEESRLSGWKVTDHKLALITTKSMPSLQLINKPATIALNGANNLINNSDNLNHKSSVDETANAAKKAAIEEKRREETRRRQEFIRAKRLAISNANNNNQEQNGIIIL